MIESSKDSTCDGVRLRKKQIWLKKEVNWQEVIVCDREFKEK